MILSFTSYVICYAIFVVICSFDSYATRATSAQTQRPPSARSSWRPPIMCAQERRIARDGSSYTLHDFLNYYGDELGHQYWAEARVAGAPQPGGPGPYAPPVGQDAPVAGAPQPGGPGPDAPPVGQDAPPVLPLAIQQPTRTVGALQPGVNPWQGCVFLTETLRQNGCRLLGQGRKRFIRLFIHLFILEARGGPSPTDHLYPTETTRMTMTSALAVSIHLAKKIFMRSCHLATSRTAQRLRTATSAQTWT